MDFLSIDSESRSVSCLKEMPADDLPREKCMKLGVEYLSDAELLAILYRSGTRQQNAVDLGRATLRHFGGLSGMSRRNWTDFKLQPGLGTVRALTLESALELGRRVQKASPVSPRVFNKPEIVFQEMAPRLSHLQHEEFWVLFLDRGLRLVQLRKLSSGGSTSTIVDIAEVMRLALVNRAQRLILVHNHPGRSLQASRNDLQLTENIVRGGSTLGIDVEDHVIVAGEQFLSFKSSGLLPASEPSTAA